MGLRVFRSFMGFDKSVFEVRPEYRDRLKKYGVKRFYHDQPIPFCIQAEKNESVLIKTEKQHNITSVSLDGLISTNKTKPIEKPHLSYHSMHDDLRSSLSLSLSIYSELNKAFQDVTLSEEKPLPIYPREE